MNRALRGRGGRAVTDAAAIKHLRNAQRAHSSTSYAFP